MAKKNNQTTTILIIAIIVFIIGGQQGWFKDTTTTYSTVTNTEIIEQLEIPAGECTLDINPNTIIEGDQIVGMIVDGPNTLCKVYGNDGTGWIQIAEGMTGANGKISVVDNFWVAGNFEFRAICGDCTTNTETLVVNPLPTSTCTDTDGINKMTPGHVTVGGLSYYDDCTDGMTVKEFYCNGNILAERILPCDAGYSCFETRSGDYCRLDAPTYGPGDLITEGFQEFILGNGVSNFFNIDLGGLGVGDIPLCAEIGKRSTKLEPQCGSMAMVDINEWKFFDSFGQVWGRVDSLAVDQHSGPDTFTNPDVVSVGWDGQTPFMGTMSHMGPCEMIMQMKVQIKVCD